MTTEQRCAWQKARHLAEIARTDAWRQWGFGSMQEYLTVDFPKLIDARLVKMYASAVRFVDRLPSETRQQIERLPLARVLRVGRMYHDPGRAVAILLRTRYATHAATEATVVEAAHALKCQVAARRDLAWYTHLATAAETAGLTVVWNKSRQIVRSVAGVPVHLATCHDWFNRETNHHFLKLRCYRPGFFLVRVNPKTGEWFYIPPLKRIPESGNVYIPEREYRKLMTMPSAKVLQNALLRARRAMRREA